MNALPDPVPETVVMKFGGSSVADADKIRHVARRLVAAHARGLTHAAEATMQAPARVTPSRAAIRPCRARGPSQSALRPPAVPRPTADRFVALPARTSGDLSCRGTRTCANGSTATIESAGITRVRPIIGDRTTSPSARPE